MQSRAGPKYKLILTIENAHPLRSGPPLPLREHLSKHTVTTAFELGWSNLKNGELLTAAETSFDLFITTDQQFAINKTWSEDNWRSWFS
jgi:hypothetical protein